MTPPRGRGFSEWNKLEHSIQEALRAGAIFKVYCGIDLYITEPSALRQLYHYLKGNDKNRLKILPPDNQATFHPKIYCFHISDGNVSVVIGSANLTNGGLCNNIELSVLEHTSSVSDLYGQIKTFFEYCENIAEDADEFTISQYQRKYEIYSRKINQANKDAEKEVGLFKSLNISEMKTCLKKYMQDQDQQKNFAVRAERYQKARQVLDEILDSSISSESEFLSFYEQLVGGAEKKEARWHSGSLFRNKQSVANEYKLFIEMLRTLKDNIEASPDKVFGLGLEYVKSIKGLGVNVLTEILNTYSPKRFAVLNNNPITSLKYFGCAEFPHPGNFKPVNYLEYNELIGKISFLCKFDDMSRVDHFFNYIYWQIRHNKPIPIQ
jgi:hypothetical protein